MIEYKIWKGKWPFVILLSDEDVDKIVYDRPVQIDQIYPNPAIVEWMKNRDYEYQSDWKLVCIGTGEWALCFNNKEICEMFVLRWL